MVYMLHFIDLCHTTDGEKYSQDSNDDNDDSDDKPANQRDTKGEMPIIIYRSIFQLRSNVFLLLLH